jgi:hypothetical protein
MKETRQTTKKLIERRILSELTNIIAPTKIYQFAGVFHIRKPLKANNSIVEITSAYRKNRE